MEKMYNKDKLKRNLTIIAAIILVSAFLWIVLGFGKSKEVKKVEVPSVEVLSEEKTLDESIRAKFSDELTSLKEENRKLKSDFDKFAKLNDITIKKSNEKDNETDKKFKDIMDQIKLGGPKKDDLEKQANLLPPPEDLAQNDLSPQYKQTSDMIKNSLNGNSYKGGPQQMESSPVVTVMSGLISVGEVKLSGTDNIEPVKVEKKKNDLIIPAGSFVRAQLASGVIAPTGGQGANNPVPVLLRITGLTQLPNFYKADIKNCFLLAETKGNLAAETVNFRLKTLSCKKNDGTTLEREVEGYITGENGVEGLSGRVVSKQGAVIARAFLAEFASGIGEIFEAQGTTTSITGAGVIESINPSYAIQSGIASGVSGAFSRLGDFYMDLAEQIVPVIEINAGRKVDVVFIKSVDLNDTEIKQSQNDKK